VFVNQKYVDDKFEVEGFVLSLDSILDKGGWLAPSGEKILDKNLFTNIWNDVPGYEGYNAAWIELESSASASTKNAAKTFSASLLSEQVMAAYPESSFGPSPITDSRVMIVVVSRRPLP